MDSTLGSIGTYLVLNNLVTLIFILIFVNCLIKGGLIQAIGFVARSSVPRGDTPQE